MIIPYKIAMAITAPTPSVAAQLRGRPREFDVDEALDKAIVIFSDKGYHATSIGDLTRVTDLASGSLYKAFKDKRAIFLAAFDRYKQIRNGLLAEAVARGATGREKIANVVAFYAAASHGAEGRQGCLVIGCAVDLATTDAEIAAKVDASQEATRVLLVRLIAAGKQDGSIPVHVDAEVVARLLLCVIQGMRVIGKSGRTEQEMIALVDAAMKILA